MRHADTIRNVAITHTRIPRPHHHHDQVFSRGPQLACGFLEIMQESIGRHGGRIVARSRLIRYVQRAQPFDVADR